MSQHSGREAEEQSTPTAAAGSPVADTANTGAGADISSHEIDTPSQAEARPNVHMQRLGAVGNFLIFRWDRLRPPRDRQCEGPSAGAGGGPSRGLDVAHDSANDSGHGEPRGAEPPAFHPAGAVAVGALRVARVMSDVCLYVVSLLLTG